MTLAKPKARVKPYSRRIDALGRAYVVEVATGKRVSPSKLGAKAKSTAKPRKPRKPAKVAPQPRKPVKPAPKPRKPVKPAPKPRKPVKPVKPAPKPRKPVKPAPKPRKPVKAAPKPRKPRKPAAPTYSKEYVDALLVEERKRWEAEQAQAFVHPFTIPGFAEDIRERAQRFPKVQVALDIASTIVDIPLAPAEVAAREAFFEAYYSGQDDMNRLVYDLSEMLELDVQEFYDLAFSPEPE